MRTVHKAKPVYEQHPIFFRLAEAAEGRISLLQENSLKKKGPTLWHPMIAMHPLPLESGPWLCALKI